MCSRPATSPQRPSADWRPAARRCGTRPESRVRAARRLDRRARSRRGFAFGYNRHRGSLYCCRARRGLGRGAVVPQPSDPTQLPHARSADTRRASRIRQAVRGAVVPRRTPGEALVVTGANGTGKTTLLRMLAGLSCACRGRDPLERPPGGAVRSGGCARQLAFAGHAARAQGRAHRRGESGVAARARRRRTRRDEAIDGALDDGRARIAPAQLPARVLSQGQRRRIGLARLALLARPLWILDEPATALDAAGVAAARAK